MRRILWHVPRAAVMLYVWLILYRWHMRVSPGLSGVLLFAIAYDVALAAAPRRVTPQIRCKIAAAAFVVCLVLMPLEPEPWEDVPGYAFLALYLPELVTTARRWWRKLAVASLAAALGAVVALSCLFRLAVYLPCRDASVNGRRIPCQVVRVVGSSKTVVMLHGGWNAVDIREHTVEDTSRRQVMPLGRFAVVDVRLLHGIPITEEPGKTGWAPKLKYDGATLSFYTLPDELFVCRVTGI